MPERAPKPPGPRRVLRCAACGRAIECGVPALLRYVVEGWPRCCGQVMALSTDGDVPRADPGPPG